MARERLLPKFNLVDSPKSGRKSPHFLDFSVFIFTKPTTTCARYLLVSTQVWHYYPYKAVVFIWMLEAFCILECVLLLDYSLHRSKTLLGKIRGMALLLHLLSLMYLLGSVIGKPQIAPELFLNRLNISYGIN